MVHARQGCHAPKERVELVRQVVCAAKARCGSRHCVASADGCGDLWGPVAISCGLVGVAQKEEQATAAQPLMNTHWTHTARRERPSERGFSAVPDEHDHTGSDGFLGFPPPPEESPSES